MKKAMLTATILVGTLLSGAEVAAAAPPFPGPTDIVTPATPPEPEPCRVKYAICDITMPTLVEPPTDIANPPVTDTTTPTGPTDVAPPTETTETTETTGTTEPSEPAEPPETGEPPVTTTTQRPPAERENPLSGVPTPNRIDTGAGPADPVNWWVVALPLLALLGLAAAGAWLVIQRSERRPS